MNCSISGEVAEEPVVSKYGDLYEKRVILKLLASNGNTCPHTKQPLAPEDLIPVKTAKAVRPRPTAATSIPGVLQLLQNEWDAVMLETFQLKQQLDNVRQDLAHALYQHDAACRVIARLIKERDDARAQLAAAPKHAEQASTQAMDAEPTSQPPPSQGRLDEDIRKIVAKAQELSSERKKRALPASLSTAEEIAAYTVLSTNNIHKASEPGVLAVDIHPNQELLATGGADSVVTLFSRNNKKIAQSFKEHQKKITDVTFHPYNTEDVLVFSSSADHTAKLWKQGQEESLYTLRTHKAEVVGVAVHPTGDYFLTASADATWAFNEVQSGKTVAQVTSDKPLSAVSIHPDGVILGTGSSDSVVKVWDLKTQKNVASFEGHQGAVVDIAFSENGYYLATTAEDNTVKLWDLRKLKNFHSIQLGEKFHVSAVQWDYSGSYLAIAGASIHVYIGKTLTQAADLTKHTATVTDVKWGKDAHWLASTSLDRSLKTWGKK